jgi:hypothetical protein
MSSSIPRIAASAPTEDVVAGLDEHGAVIVQGVLDSDLLTRFNAELDPILEQVSPCGEQQFLHRDEDVWVHLPRPHAEVELASLIALTVDLLDPVDLLARGKL